MIASFLYCVIMEAKHIGNVYTHTHIWLYIYIKMCNLLWVVDLRVFKVMDEAVFQQSCGKTERPSVWNNCNSFLTLKHKKKKDSVV